MLGKSANGFIVPVLIDSSDGMIAGHGRVLAARKLHLQKVPVIVAIHLTDTEKRAYAIADNKIALNAGWDEQLLKVEIEALKNDGVNLETLGFSEEELMSYWTALEPTSSRTKIRLQNHPPLLYR